MGPTAGVWRSSQAHLRNARSSALFYLPEPCVNVSRLRRQMQKLGYKFFWDWSALTRFDGMLVLLVWEGLAGHPCETAVTGLFLPRAKSKRDNRPVRAPIFWRKVQAGKTVHPITQHKLTGLSEFLSLTCPAWGGSSGPVSTTQWGPTQDHALRVVGSAEVGWGQLRCL